MKFKKLGISFSIMIMFISFIALSKAVSINNDNLPLNNIGPISTSSSSGGNGNVSGTGGSNFEYAYWTSPTTISNAGGLTFDVTDNFTNIVRGGFLNTDEIDTNDQSSVTIGNASIYFYSASIQDYVAIIKAFQADNNIHFRNLTSNTSWVFDSNVIAPNICYKNGTNCAASGGGMNYNNLVLDNKSNNFTAVQGIVLAGTFSDDGNGNISGSGTNWLTDLQVGDEFTDDQTGAYGFVQAVFNNTRAKVEDLGFGDTPPSGAIMTVFKPSIKVNAGDGSANKLITDYNGGFISAGNPSGPVSKTKFQMSDEYGLVNFAKTAPNSLIYPYTPLDGKTTRVFQFTDLFDTVEYFSWDIDVNGNPAFNLKIGKDFLFGNQNGGIWHEMARLTNAGAWNTTLSMTAGTDLNANNNLVIGQNGSIKNLNVTNNALVINNLTVRNGSIYGNGSGLTQVCLTNGTNCGGIYSLAYLALTNITNFFNASQIILNSVGVNYSVNQANTSQVFQINYTQQTYSFINDSLVGWWRFNNESDENVTKFVDRSIYANNGTCNFCPKLNVTNAAFNNSMTFNGSALSVTNISLPFIQAYNFTRKNMSISVWVNSFDPTAQFKMVIARSLGDAANSDFEIRFSGTTGKIDFLRSKNDNAQCTVTSASALSANRWYHIVAEVNDSACMVYINGTLESIVGVASGSNWSSTLGTNFPIKVGARNTNIPSYYFNGSIDDLLIFNRTLNGTEIQSLYNSSAFNLNKTVTNLNQNNNYSVFTVTQNNGVYNCTDYQCPANITIANNSIYTGQGIIGYNINGFNLSDNLIPKTDNSLNLGNNNNRWLSGFILNFFSQNMNTTNLNATNIYTTTYLGTNTTTKNLTIINHEVSKGTTPTISSCGTNPSVIGTDSRGIINIGSGISTTSCDLTFAGSYRNASCNVNDNSLTITADISTLNNTDMITSFGASLSGGVVYYTCGEVG